MLFVVGLISCGKAKEPECEGQDTLEGSFNLNGESCLVTNGTVQSVPNINLYNITGLTKDCKKQYSVICSVPEETGEYDFTNSNIDGSWTTVEFLKGVTKELKSGKVNITKGSDKKIRIKINAKDEDGKSIVFDGETVFKRF